VHNSYGMSCLHCEEHNLPREVCWRRYVHDAGWVRDAALFNESVQEVVHLRARLNLHWVEGAFSVSAY
jgi:hypothetical protein